MAILVTDKEFQILLTEELVAGTVILTEDGAQHEVCWPTDAGLFTNTGGVLAIETKSGRRIDIKSIIAYCLVSKRTSFVGADRLRKYLTNLRSQLERLEA